MASARSRRSPGGPAVVEAPPEVAPPPLPARSALGRGGVFVLVLLLTVLLALWGAFLVPLRLGGHAVPVGVLLAALTFPLCRAGGDALGRRTGAAVPMALWAAIAAALSTERREGDLVITGSLRGLAFLLVGLLCAAVAVGSWRPAERS